MPECAHKVSKRIVWRVHLRLQLLRRPFLWLFLLQQTHEWSHLCRVLLRR